MKIRIELDSGLSENEVLIRCSSLNEEVQMIQNALEQVVKKTQQFVFYKGDVEYYFPLDDVLFFETEEKTIYAHTIDNMYLVKYKLYELEAILPEQFMRISKSTILNIDKVYSIQRNITASSVVEFMHTHKKVYVSRHYYRTLKEKLEEKRNRR